MAKSPAEARTFGETIAEAYATESAAIELAIGAAPMQDLGFPRR